VVSTELPAAPTAAAAAPTAANPFATREPLPPDAPLDTTPVATLAPTAPPVTPSPTPAVVIIPATVGVEGNEQRWRAQQVGREVLSPPIQYEATAQTALMWYDPATGQILEIGTLRGTFTVQAQFTFRPTDSAALEVPYRINGDYGLTAISEAIQQRMNAAGYRDSVEAFVLLTPAIVPKP
jgi:hypothetical protein